MGYLVSSSCSHVVVLILIFMSTLSFLMEGVVCGYTAGAWGSGHATFYGGADASGTQGGACGYGNLYNSGYGVKTAALSVALFNSGAQCGACYQIACTQSRWCISGASSITITATNLCPSGSTGGWCDPPKQHFDLSQPMFTSIALYAGGVVPVNYRRVACARQGGVRWTINGNPYFFLVLVYNVGGAGDVQEMYVKGSSTGWYNMWRNWGTMWTATPSGRLQGQALSFRIVTSDGNSLTSWNAAPSNWAFGQTFEGSQY